MTEPITVPAAAPLSTVANVELMHTGQWDISTGRVTVTTDDLVAAVASQDCPAVRRPILKLGHDEPDHTDGIRWDGEPSIGWVADMRLAEDGRMLVGDYVGMPGWLGDVIASAYPDRSAEWVYDYRCQLGHTHPVVVTAMALLGVVAPGIGTLQSLQDVAALYGVQAATEPTTAPGAVPVTFRLRAQGGAMPNPRPAMVAASVSVEDVRRAYYSDNPSWDVYIEEFQLDPPQLIVVNDATGTRQRIPVTIGDGDGEAAVQFGDPVSVVIRYDDAATQAASTGAQVLRWASKAESRPQPPAAPAPGSTVHTTPQKGAAGMDAALLREALGLPADASDTEVTAALATAGLASAAGSGQPAPDPTDPPAPTPAPGPGPLVSTGAGVVTIDASTYAEIQAAAERTLRLERRLAARDRDEVIGAAVQAGKFAPARREHYARLWDSDPEGTRALIEGLTPNMVPVAAKGVAGSEDDDVDDAEFASLFPPEPKSRRR